MQQRLQTVTSYPFIRSLAIADGSLVFALVRMNSDRQIAATAAGLFDPCQSNRCRQVLPQVPQGVPAKDSQAEDSTEARGD